MIIDIRQGPRLHFGSAIAVAVLFFGFGIRVSTAAASAFANDRTATGGFCAGSELSGRNEVIKSLPKVHRIPSSKSLSFAPKGLRIELISREFALAGLGKIGVYLEEVRRGEPVEVNWTVSSTLVRVNRTGGVLGRAMDMNTLVKKVSSQKGQIALGFKTPRKLGIYRFDISFSDDKGNLLGSYSEYVEVVKRKAAVSLELNASVYSPGGTLLYRPRNEGTILVGYGLAYAIERWTGEAWVLDPVTPSMWPMEGFGIGGRHTGPCEKARLGQIPGRYRITKEFQRSLTGASIYTSAEFEIVG